MKTLYTLSLFLLALVPTIKGQEQADTSTVNLITNDTLTPNSVYDDSDSVIYIVVDTPPDFPGGPKEMYKYLGANLRYPSEALENKIQGRVYVSFIVEKDGSISDVTILRGIGAGCDSAAIAVVKSMPKWIPGVQNGEIVRVRFNLPIDFKLSGKKSKKKKQKNK